MRPLEQSQQKCAAVLRSELRKNNRLEPFRDSRKSGKARARRLAPEAAASGASRQGGCGRAKPIQPAPARGRMRRCPAGPAQCWPAACRARPAEALRRLLAAAAQAVRAGLRRRSACYSAGSKAKGSDASNLAETSPLKMWRWSGPRSSLRTPLPSAKSIFFTSTQNTLGEYTDSK